MEQKTMIEPHWKQRLYHEPLHGCFVTFSSPALCEFTARMGFDFILIDNEHGAMNQETLEDMVRASQCVEVPAIVRVPINRHEYIRRALDFGANGVQVPLVNTARQAREAVSASHFPPRGERGVAFLTRAANYGMCPDKARYIEDADASKLVSVHIETPEAVANLDAILDVEGIDVLFIGPGDLAVSMGYANSPNHPDVMETMENCIRRISQAGKIAGTYVGDADRAAMAIDWGATYLVTAITPYMVQAGTQYLINARKR
ncbi:aldolase/citrate lyase family protein [Atlantibacter subterranea]|uniref:HpcH/HpaI aldolase family protein n=1 Tax=Atlantibacter subterraneus TaxID=255519 RepID=UPI0020C3370D|nr:aldolase/citrate lyase family protein [Atlantibacter subterranea]UTJ49165.1 aldolase/citrate lyase family protein [Atlantibacter subterranea]